jgi:hypothetical protein
MQTEELDAAFSEIEMSKIKMGAVPDFIKVAAVFSE